MNATDEPVPAAEPDFGPPWPWFSCVGPLAAYLTLGTLEPGADGDGFLAAFGVTAAAYPAVYALRICVTAAVIAAAWPSLAKWLGRPTWWPPLLGVALVVPWIVLATLQRDAGWSGGIGERAAFDPFAAFGDTGPLAGAFLGLRFLGLVVIVPLAEELFLRGFLMRFVVREEFWGVPFGTLTAAAAGACALYAAASHPAEAVAAVGWFAVVSGIAAATRKPIDCVLTHAATNLALGVYVVATGNWWLW
ncbi:CAAX prenyl protease-related protein [bacterium]|nr:CAAX prenyl protease-related protein [bacterium]